jgi:hypothetical protein
VLRSVDLLACGKSAFSKDALTVSDLAKAHDPTLCLTVVVDACRSSNKLARPRASVRRGLVSSCKSMWQWVIHTSCIFLTIRQGRVWKASTLQSSSLARASAETGAIYYPLLFVVLKHSIHLEVSSDGRSDHWPSIRRYAELQVVLLKPYHPALSNSEISPLIFSTVLLPLAPHPNFLVFISIADCRCQFAALLPRRALLCLLMAINDADFPNETRRPNPTPAN